MNGMARNTALALLGGLLSLGCAQDVGDIDRTQPNLLDKELFSGSWYVRETVTNVPATSGFAFVGATGELELIKWEIQQDFLVGYRSYERIPGTDEAADAEGAEVGDTPVEEGFEEGRNPDNYRGAPIVMYPILDHVDVQREYNPRTGEQTNVIVENSSDRPWHERRFMRIDWATPQVLNPNFITQPLGFGVSSAAYVEENEGGADAFRIEDEDGNRWSLRGDDFGDVAYMDVTHRLFVEPDAYDCYAAYQNALGDCAPAEVDVRTSFLKVDEERERAYEPALYDDHRQGEFGYFRTERPTYDRRRGITHGGVIRLANRHDMWEASLDAEGNTIPYAERELRPIVYALSPHYPEGLRAITDELAAEYDANFKRIASFLREQTVEQLEADLEAQTGATCLFCIDENEDGSARIGDLRHNFIYWVDNPQVSSPLGYGPSSANPETGRIVAGMAYVYGAGVDTYAQQAKDIVDLLNGDLSEDEITGAEYIRNEIAGRRSAIDPRAAASLENIDFSADAPEAILGPTRAAHLRDVAVHGLPAARPGFDQRQLARIEGTEFESYLLEDEMYSLLNDPSVQPGDTLSDEQLEELSPANWLTMDSMRKQAERHAHAARHNVWLADFADPSIVGLAKQMKDEGITGEALWQKLREQIFKAVMLHEIGHTVGLRHNFGASADALNYHDEYWPLRVQSNPGGNIATVADLLRRNCSLVDGTNEAACASQRENRMSEYQYSSIMDYGAKFNSDIQGLGKYDTAALAAGYGDIVEVFDPAVTDGMNGVLQDFGVTGKELVEIVAGYKNPLYGSLGELVHYSNFPALFGGVENLNRREWMPREEYEAMRDAGGPIRVPYVACYDEYRDQTAICHTWDEGADAYEISMQWIRAYKDYFVLNNFARDRVGFSSSSVLNRVGSRYFAPLANMYQNWLFNYGSGDVLNDVYSTLGMTAGFNTLWNVMSTPRYGSYCRDDDSYAWLTYDNMDVPGYDPNRRANLLANGGCDAGDDQVYVAPGYGRRAFSRYDFDAGYYLFDRVIEVGSFYEQAAALSVLTSNQSVLGIGQDVAADSLAYSIPYYIIFQEDIDQLFGGIINNEHRAYGPKFAGGEVLTRDLFAGFEKFYNIPSGQNPTGNVEPYLKVEPTWSTRFRTMLFGTALLKSNFDLSFVHRMQISLQGSGEVIQPGAGFEPVTYSDPLSGRVYEAYQPTELTDDTWLAAEKINRLNRWTAEREAVNAELLTFLQDEIGVDSVAEVTNQLYTAMSEEQKQFFDDKRGELQEFDRDIRGDAQDLELMRGIFQYYGSAF